MARKISESTVRRLSLHMRSLEQLERDGVETISSEELALRGGTTAAQVRKDLSHFGSFGKRGLGYSVPELRRRLREILGLDRCWRIALVGAGRIGSALFAYPDFGVRGFRIVTVLDNDPAKVGQRWGDVTVRHADDLEAAIREEEVELVVLAVPADAAQDVLDRAVRAGARGVLNFAPASLRVPPEVPVQDVNLVTELEALTCTLTHADELEA